MKPTKIVNIQYLIQVYIGRGAWSVWDEKDSKLAVERRLEQVKTAWPERTFRGVMRVITDELL